MRKQANYVACDPKNLSLNRVATLIRTGCTVVYFSGY